MKGKLAINGGMLDIATLSIAYDKLVDMPASMQMSDLKADVTSHVWNTGLKAEYKFNAGALDIVPHVGGALPWACDRWL